MIDERVLRALFASIGRGVPDDLEVVRVGANIVVRSEAEGLIWRISQGVVREQITRNVLAAAELSRAPVVPPATLDVATADPDYAMTQWPLARTLPQAGAYAALGDCLSRLHHISPPSRLPRFNDFSLIDRRLELARKHGAPKPLLNRLRTRADRVVPVMREVVRSGDSLVHGDAHVGNLVELGGAAKLIDLDGLCVGPWQLDLLPTKVAYDRLGLPEQHWNDFIDACGSTICEWEFAAIATTYREITILTWLASLWGESGVAEELTHRLETWDAPPREHPPWRPL